MMNVNMPEKIICMKAKGVNVCFDHNNDSDGNHWVLSTRWKRNNIDISLPHKIINLHIEQILVQEGALLVYFILKLDMIKIMSSL